MFTSIGLDEACELFNVEKTHFQRLVREGEIPGAKIGREWVFIKEMLMDYLRDEIVRQTNERKSKKNTIEEIHKNADVGMYPIPTELLNIKPNESGKRGAKRRQLTPLAPLTTTS